MEKLNIISEENKIILNKQECNAVTQLKIMNQRKYFLEKKKKNHIYFVHNVR